MEVTGEEWALGLHFILNEPPSLYSTLKYAPKLNLMDGKVLAIYNSPVKEHFSSDVDLQKSYLNVYRHPADRSRRERGTKA